MGEATKGILLQRLSYANERSCLDKNVVVVYIIMEMTWQNALTEGKKLILT